MATRRRAREIVLQLLYEDDLNPEQDRKVAEKFLETRLHRNRPLVEFAKELWLQVVKNREQLDKALTKNATNWSLRRMAAIDRNVLRLGAYEILMTDTPGVVAINEAVDLAKRYGNQQSGQFVNGILDRILNQPEQEADSETSLADETTADQATESPVDQASDSAESPIDEPATDSSPVSPAGTE